MTCSIGTIARAAGAGAACVAAIAGEVADAAIALPEDARGPAAAVIALTVGAGAVAATIAEAAGAAAAIALPEDARGPAAGAAATKGCAGWRFPSTAKPWSSSEAICRSRLCAERPPMITPISRRPLRTAEVAMLKPEALTKPVLMPSAP